MRDPNQQDRDALAALKEEAYDNASRIERGGSSRKPHRKHASNYTPPKKRRK